MDAMNININSLSEGTPEFEKLVANVYRKITRLFYVGSLQEDPRFDAGNVLVLDPIWNRNEKPWWRRYRKPAAYSVKPTGHSVVTDAAARRISSFVDVFCGTPPDIAETVYWDTIDSWGLGSAVGPRFQSLSVHSGGSLGKPWPILHFLSRAGNTNLWDVGRMWMIH